MAKKQTFPVPGCSNCPHHQVVGGITRYCNGFKRRKPKRFRSSDPRFKAPKWCPRRISPPICRIYGFRDERCKYMEMLWRMEYDMGRSKIISPSAFHYELMAKPTIPAIIKGHQWNKKTYGISGNYSVYLDGEKVTITDEQAKDLSEYVDAQTKYLCEVQKIKAERTSTV